MQVEVDQVARKVVVGMRQLADESIAIDGGTHSDRIRGYAAELADVIGYVEPSADLLAARELAASGFEHSDTVPPIHSIYSVIHYTTGARLLLGNAARVAEGFHNGELDDSASVQERLAAIAKGRELAAVDAEHQKIADMMSAPHEARIVPDRLTITIDGPQGSGKTVLGQWLTQALAVMAGQVWPAGFRTLDTLKELLRQPGARYRIVEMRDGGRFDVGADEFLEG